MDRHAAKRGFVFWIDQHDFMLDRIQSQKQRLEAFKREKNPIQKRALQVEFEEEQHEIPEQCAVINRMINSFNARTRRLGLKEIPSLPDLGGGRVVERRVAPKPASLNERLAAIRRRAAEVTR